MLPSPNSAFSTFSPSIAVTSFLKFLLWPGELDGVELCDGLGSTATEFELHHLHVLLLDHGGQVLGEKVRWVVRAQHFLHPELLLAHAVLGPQVLDVNVAELAEAAAVDDPQRGAGVGVDHGRRVDAEVPGHRHDT